MSAPVVARGRVRRLAILATTSLVAASLLSGPSSAIAASGGKDHFKATIADGGAGEAGELRTPQDFEQEAADHPQAGDQTLFSRCRYDLGSKVYGAFGSHEHDAIVGDTTFPLANNTSCYNPQNEQNIVINPSDSRNIVTSSNEYRAIEQAVYVSKNGGATWTDVALTGWTRSTGGSGAFSGVDSCGDPVLAFNKDGSRLYFTQLVCNFDKFPRTKSGVAIAVSTDGGSHWSDPKMIDYRATGDFFADKEWVTVGGDGTVYVTWTKFYQGPRGLGYLKSPIVMSTSTNGGASWSSVKEVSDDAHPFNQGSAPAVAPDGTLYVAYEASDPATDYATDQMVVASSTDHGTTFTQHALARVYDDFSCYPIQLPGAQDRQTLSFEQFRINSYPSFAIDPSNGHLAITWADDQGAGNCGSSDPTFTGAATSNQVKLMTSADGTNWSSVQTITTGAADKVYPSVGANDGRVVVGYYTRAYSPSATVDNRSCGIAELDSNNNVVAPVDAARAAAPVCLDWALRSSDNGFATETRVTTESSNPYILFSGSFIGDYTGTAIDAAGHAVTVWTDFRGNPGTTKPNQDALVATGY
ncbi:MAG TPA: sialidase family protein [Candidatus Deferrimicrobium sp.]|nr:sialidase family protein [Candidatus Deferrimicrobium sp.]